MTQPKMLHRGRHGGRTSEADHNSTRLKPGVRIAVALGVLLGGIGLAMLFRHPAPPGAAPPASSGASLVLRERIEPEQPKPDDAAERAAAESTAPRRNLPAEPQPLTVLRPAVPADPPALARDYPSVLSGPRASQPVGSFPGLRRQDAPPAPRRHTVVDGDSLESLAARYLGDRSRAEEIFESNRGVLSHPDLLPIGVELVLPPRDRASGRPAAERADPLTSRAPSGAPRGKAPAAFENARRALSPRAAACALSTARLPLPARRSAAVG